MIILKHRESMKIINWQKIFDIVAHVTRSGIPVLIVYVSSANRPSQSTLRSWELSMGMNGVSKCVDWNPDLD